MEMCFDKINHLPINGMSSSSGSSIGSSIRRINVCFTFEHISVKRALMSLILFLMLSTILLSIPLLVEIEGRDVVVAVVDDDDDDDDGVEGDVVNECVVVSLGMIGLQKTFPTVTST